MPFPFLVVETKDQVEDQLKDQVEDQLKDQDQLIKRIPRRSKRTLETGR